MDRIVEQFSTDIYEVYTQDFMVHIRPHDDIKDKHTTYLFPVSRIAEIQIKKFD